MKAVQHELIRLRAYEIWERSGYPDGLDKEHWEQAEQELLDAAPAVEASAGADFAGAEDPDSPEAKVTPVPDRAGVRNRGQESQEAVKRL
jgi:hypothetical protein